VKPGTAATPAPALSGWAAPHYSRLVTVPPAPQPDAPAPQPAASGGPASGAAGPAEPAVAMIVAETTPAATLFAPLAGRPVLEHSVAAFAAAGGIGGVLVVVPPGLASRVEQLIAAGDYPVPVRVIEDGGPRTAAIERALPPGDGPILIHDAAQPLVSVQVIENCLTALATQPCVCAAIPASDTMVAVTGDYISARTVRDRLRRRQSPHGFRLPVLRQVCEQARAADAGPATGATATGDECALTLRLRPDVPVHLIPGSERSFSITGPDDLALAEAVLAGPNR